MSPQAGATPEVAAQNGAKGGKERLSPPILPGLQFPSSTRTNYTTWLLVRDAVGDSGVRPLAGGTVFWESPDVWVESTSGINRPVAGQPNQVFARVTNLGWQYATGVTVKFWWADPSLAITETTANLIGIGWADIPSGWSVAVQCPKPWVPIVENEGHECLIAEAFIPHFDALTAPMDPVDDRHVGQRNERLVMLGAGESFITRIKAINVTGLPQALTFEVQPLRLASIPPLLAARARLLPANLQPPSSVLPLTLNVSDAPAVFTQPSTLFAGRQLSLDQQGVAGTAVDTAVPVQITQTAQFEPWESRIIEVTGQIPSSAQVGQSYAFRIVQRIGRMITGGYTVNVVVVKG
jgi:hypothetical protein